MTLVHQSKQQTAAYLQSAKLEEKHAKKWPLSYFWNEILPLIMKTNIEP